MKLCGKTMEWLKGVLLTVTLLSALGIVWSLTTITDTSVATDSINVTGNVTATYFIGNGSRLTGIASNGTGDITAVNTHGRYVYGGAVSGIADIYFNETQLNSTIDARNNGTSFTSLACSNITGAASNLCTITQFSGNYADLTGNPTLLSNFTNDLGYLRTESDPTIGTQLSGRICISNGTHINCTINASSATETDPVFISSAAAAINATNISRWNLAYGWGNHALAGYLTSFTELDPVYLASAAHSILAANITEWNNAYAWGNHAIAGYLKANATNNATKWNLAYGWGNHALIGYLKANTTNNATKWNTAYAWGNHSTAGYLKTESDPQIGAVTNTKWCAANGTAVNCNNSAPVLAEVDPIVNIKTAGKLCSYSASKVNCNVTSGAGNVTASGTPTSGQVAVFSSTTNVAGSSVLKVNGSNVGIGTSAPTQALDVRGNIKSSGFVQQNRSGYIEYYNEFIGDAVDTYPITLGTQSIQSDPNVFGTYRWISGAVAGNDAGIGLGYSTTTTGTYYNLTYSYLETRMLWGNTAGQRFFIGSLKTSVSADTSTVNAGTFFMTNTSIGGYWQAVACNGSGAANWNIVNTTIARDSTAYHVFAINSMGTYAEYYIDNVLRANISSKYPKNTNIAWIGTYQETTDVNADNHRLDYIYYRAKRR